MSNSSLTDVTILSPNYSTRASKISKITIHHMAGVMSAEGCGNWFKTGTRAASSNYGIGYDGKIGLYVPEDKRAWTSSSRANDNMAVTIELSNSSKGGNWPVSDKVIERCIDLVTDICQRNSIEALRYTGTTAGNLTRHDMFIATNCPGSYLASKLPYIVKQVNARLAEETKIEPVVVVYTPSAIESGVYAFQKWLNDNFALGIAEDGEYGPKTRKAAIKAFQSTLNSLYKCGLRVDGIWGNKTSTATLNNVKLRRGNANATLTFILQGMLYCHKVSPQGLDGDFGANTETATKTYQKNEGIGIDGVAGKMTFSRLFSS